MTKKAKELFLQEVAWYHQTLEKYHVKTEELCSTIDSVPVDHLSKTHRLDCRELRTVQECAQEIC